MSRTRQFIASLLVLSYGLVAVGGHGLHALLPCGDPECVAEATSATCSCGLCHSEPETTPADGTDIQGPAVGTPKTGHNSQTCVVCALLAKVKVGHSQFDFSPESAGLVQNATPQLVSVVLTLAHSNHAPRGPPMGC